MNHYEVRAMLRHELTKLDHPTAKNALDWLERTGDGLDIDDDVLAERNAKRVIAALAERKKDP